MITLPAIRRALVRLLAPISRHPGRRAAMARAVGPARVQQTMADKPSSSAARRAACAIATVTALVEGTRRRVRPRS